jgi:hypothetical protein
MGAACASGQLCQKGFKPMPGMASLATAPQVVCRVPPLTTLRQPVPFYFRTAPAQGPNRPSVCRTHPLGHAGLLRKRCCLSNCKMLTNKTHIKCLL